MDLTAEHIIVTGAAGFIGFHVCRQLLADYPSCLIVGLDSLNDYYDVRLKHARLKELGGQGKTWRFEVCDICDADRLAALFDRYQPSLVVHLAAQAGVRHSVSHPVSCVSSNVLGFVNVLEACRKHGVEHLVYASSSSVYGEHGEGAFRETDRTDSPVSLYAATKKSDEVLAHSYSSLFGLPCTGVRIFTAYGPWGRPDMAYFRFAESWRKGEKIQLYNGGLCRRDFTYVDDVAEGIERLLTRHPAGAVPHEVFNLGGGSTVVMTDFVALLHASLAACGVLPAGHDLSSAVELVGAQLGDVSLTIADPSHLEEATGFRPLVTCREGLMRFAAWYGGQWAKVTEGY